MASPRHHDDEHFRYFVERSPDGDVSSLMRVLTGDEPLGQAYVEGEWLPEDDPRLLLEGPHSELEAIDPDDAAHLMRELDLRSELDAARDEAVDPDEVAHHLRELQPPTEPDA